MYQLKVNGQTGLHGRNVADVHLEYDHARAVAPTLHHQTVVHTAAGLDRSLSCVEEGPVKQEVW